MADQIVLAGGSGFLGQALARRLVAEGRDVVVLTRQPRPTAPFREVAWDGRTAGAWARELEGAAAVVNLTGRSINCVYNAKNRAEIIASRVEAVKALGQACRGLARPPAAWIQASATGFYGDAGDAVCDESRPPGSDFLAEVCRHWEAAFAALDLPGVRRVVVRIGPVFDADHGALPPLVKLTRRFLGGSVASGRQFISWIHRDDLVAGIVHALREPGVAGVYNLCAPAPVTNRELMKALRTLLHRPWIPPAPAFAVKLAAPLVMGVDPTLALHGQRASVRKMQAAGLGFKHPTLREALQDLLEGRAGL